MIESSKLFVFLTAAVLLAVAPGPGMLYVLARSLAGGKREGVLSALGTFLGGMVHVLAAALGISLILARSAVAFASVKYLGAAYLCFLGVRMILDARRDHAAGVVNFPTPREQDVQETYRFDKPGSVQSRRIGPPTFRTPLRHPLWQGVMTEVLNPKTALFFLSFIPQFVNRGAGHVFLQFVSLGTISVGLNTAADLLVIALAGPLGERIRSSVKFRRRQRTVTGAIMIGLGAYLATSESK